MKEADIRQPDHYQEFLRLAHEDAHTFFDSALRSARPCPGCASGRYDHAFSKSGFEFVLCTDCGTLYVNPCPAPWEFERFYRESPSARYFADVFFPPVMEARRERIFRPRVERLAALCAAAGLAPKVLIDIGGGNGIFLEEWRRSHPGTHVCTIEPGARFAEVCRAKSIDVFEGLAEDANAWAGRADVVTCFEVIEHVPDPTRFVRSLLRLLRPGGGLLLTALSSEGFDIQVLWERANAVCPPLHLHFMSLRGFETLFARAGFSNIAIETPGQLDADIVRNAVAQDGADVLSRFDRTLIGRGEPTLSEFQRFLSRNRLSSHCSIWAGHSASAQST